MRSATFEGFGAMLIRQFEMREPAASEIEHAVDAPIGAGAAGFADAGAVGKAQRATGPTQLRAWCFGREQSFHHDGEEVRCLVQPVFDAGVAEVSDPLHGRPGRRLTQRQPTRSASKRDPQQRRATDQRPLALDRLGLQRKTIKVQTGGKTGQQIAKVVGQNRCCVSHLPPESSQPASGQGLS